MRPRLAAAVFLLALPAAAQLIAADPVSFRVELDPPEAGPGDEVTARVVVTVEPPWHIYGLEKAHQYMSPTEVRLTLPMGYHLVGTTGEPEPETHRDETLGADVPWHAGTVTFTQRFRLSDRVTPGEATIGVELAYMACTDRECLDPATQSTTARLTVLARSAGTAAPEPGEGEGSSDTTGLWIAFLGGLGSILLPCVYPLIPLTIAFFAKHEGSGSSVFTRALLFCAGILITFTVLGVALGPAIQALANSLWLNLFLFLLMVVLALSLLGMFDIRLPSALTDRMQAAGSGASVFAPVAMGVAFSLASFSCTVGVIGPVLTGATEWTHATSRMFSYSVGFALPFFVLALFPMLVSAMPRGGGWMNTIKVMLGFFEICFAGYYLWKLDLSLGWGVGSYEIVLALWTVTVFLAGLYLLGKVTLPHDSPLDRVPVHRAVGAIVTFAAGLLLFAGLMGTLRLPAWLNGLLPPRAAAATVAEAPTRPRPEWADADFHAHYGGNWWTSDHEKALEIGRRTGRRVFLNFTGIFCTNCRTMEEGLFLDPEVMAEFDEMVLADLYTDIPNEKEAVKFHTPVAVSRRNGELRAKTYGTTANPYYVILSPAGEILARSGYEPSRADFLAFLRTGK